MTDLQSMWNQTVKRTMFFAFAGLLAACEPSVDIKGDGRTSGAGAAAPLTASTNTASSSASGTGGADVGIPTSCGDLLSCCKAICAVGAAMPCAPPEWKDGCLCDEMSPSGSSFCDDVLLSYLQCFLEALPGALICEGSELLADCTVCVEGSLALTKVCGGQLDAASCAP
jgi:hypothetical protein